MNNKTNETLINPIELKNKIEQLLECDALELIPDKQKNTNRMYIPYMMNDALEYYFILEDCQRIGTFSKKIPSDATVLVSSNNACPPLKTTSSHNTRQNCNMYPRHVIIFRYKNGETLTLWFSKCVSICQFYQYHRIGHFWTNGHEHWRRLVYIIGTLHEKYTFLGDTSCNATEKELLPLIEFAPFRYWSPLHESLDDYYQNSENGITRMKQLAIDAKDYSFACMIQLYQSLPQFIQRSKWLNTFLANKLASPKHNTLYECICRKIIAASEEYRIRDYGQELNANIEKIRTRFSEELYADGYIGQYPYFKKGTADLIAIEEHPFTILESDTFEFRIRGMICNQGKHSLYQM